MMQVVTKVWKRFHGFGELIKDQARRLIKSNPAPTPDLKKSSYGEHKDQVFDLWYGDLKETGKAPVVIFFHGGGFIKGHRFYAKLLRLSHERGATVISAGYRLTKSSKVTIDQSIEDAARLVDYLKKNAEEFAIDPDKIAVTGNSAGGIMALSLAIRSQILPDIDHKVVCAAVHNAPTLLDPQRFKEVIGVSNIQPFWYLWSRLFSVMEEERLQDDRVQKIISKNSPELLLHQDSAPVYLNYSYTAPEGGKHDYENDSLVHMLHSPLFGIEMKRRADEANMTCMLSYPENRAELEAIDFIWKELKC